MDAYGPTYIVYACAVRTRNFTVDTSNRCGFGPVTSHTVQWSWGSDGANGTWYDLAELPLHRATTAPATTPNHTTPPVPTTELVDQRANVRVFAGADCIGAALWGVESMDLCYYEFPDGNFTQAAGAAGSIQILKDGVTASTYGTCLYKWDEDGPVYLQTFTGVGCHNVPAQSSVGAVEVAVKGTQLCSSGLPEGVALTVVGLILLGLYLLAGMCPLVYHAVFVAQCCIAKTKRKQIVFRD